AVFSFKAEHSHCASSTPETAVETGGILPSVGGGRVVGTASRPPNRGASLLGQRRRLSGRTARRAGAIEPVEPVRAEQDEMNHQCEREQEREERNQCSPGVEQKPHPPHCLPPTL